MMGELEKEAFSYNGWFREPGVYCVFDGQFGSTGKGLLSAAIGGAFANKIDICTTNAGPNSGHTAYIDGKKVVTHQLPISAVAAKFRPVTYLNAGAIIDPYILAAEEKEHDVKNLWIHPNAAVVSFEDMEQNREISSTGMGTGPALIRKLSRVNGGVVGKCDKTTTPELRDKVVLMEVAQGFSLGINQRFYPYCTVRECTPAQGIADLGVPPKWLRKSIAVLRTYPIRTGSLPGSTSGPHYPDQKELSWDYLGVEPEIASTTGRVRRVFSWSWQQYEEMLVATEPDALFINFCNYPNIHGKHEWDTLLHAALDDYIRILQRNPDFILLGYGPKAEDIELWTSNYGNHDS